MYKKTAAIFFLIFSVIHQIYAKDSDNFRFAVMGCAHMGECDSGDYELAVRKIKEYRPEFVSFLGGMVKANIDEPDEQLWMEFDKITGKLEMPHYDALGSCAFERMPSAAKKAALEKRFIDRYNSRYYSFEHNNSLFIYLDSDNLFKAEKGSFDEKQLNFLQKRLRDVSKYDNVFVFMHNSLWVNSEDLWYGIIHPLIKGKVSYVFGAGAHYFDLKKMDGVAYITSGFPSCFSKQSKPSFFHFLLVEVKNKKVSVRIVPIKPIPIDNMGIPETDGKNPGFPIIKSYVLASAERRAMLNPELVSEALNIKPGLNIADIGAGTGFFTFPIAKALKGTGMVFATDVDEEMIGQIRYNSRKYGYKNISAVCVNPAGVDPFYKKHNFDIIFMAETYQYLWNPQDYFSRLRPQLKKDGGRLYLICFKNVSGFCETDFSDFREIFRILNSEAPYFPIRRRLSRDVLDFSQNWKEQEVPPEIQAEIIHDFNNALSDRYLLNDLFNYYAAKKEMKESEWGRPLLEILDSKVIPLAKWLIVKLEANGVFAHGKKILTDWERKELTLLNRILISNIFHNFNLGYLKGTYPLYLEKGSIISTMQAAGYKFVREHDFLTQHYFLEFKREI